MGVNKTQRRVSPGAGSGGGVPLMFPPGPIMEKPHTLRSYASDHFRPPLASPKPPPGPPGMFPPRDFTWRHSRLPIQEPLLRRLLNKEELAHQACVTFHTILVYMGDLPGRQSRVGLELTDLIFTGPLKQASTQHLSPTLCHYSCVFLTVLTLDQERIRTQEMRPGDSSGKRDHHRP